MNAEVNSTLTVFFFCLTVMALRQERTLPALSRIVHWVRQVKGNVMVGSGA
jgi:hypothetical protein